MELPAVVEEFSSLLVHKLTASALMRRNEPGDRPRLLVYPPPSVPTERLLLILKPAGWTRLPPRARHADSRVVRRDRGKLF